MSDMTKQTDWLMYRLKALFPDGYTAFDLVRMEDFEQAIQAHIADEVAEAYKKGYIAKGIEQVNANIDEVIKGKIDELGQITGFSNVGGVYTKAGVDIKPNKNWEPVTIDDRIAELKAKLEGEK